MAFANCTSSVKRTCWCRRALSCLEKVKLCIDMSHAELWGYDIAQLLIDVWDQLNYVHFLDCSSCTVREPGNCSREWIRMRSGVPGFQTGDAGGKGVRPVVDGVSGDAAGRGGTEAAERARESRKMREYVRGVVGEETTTDPPPREALGRAGRGRQTTGWQKGLMIGDCRFEMGKET